MEVLKNWIIKRRLSLVFGVTVFAVVMLIVYFFDSSLGMFDNFWLGMTSWGVLAVFCGLFGYWIDKIVKDGGGKGIGGVQLMVVGGGVLLGGVLVFVESLFEAGYMSAFVVLPCLVLLGVATLVFLIMLISEMTKVKSSVESKVEVLLMVVIVAILGMIDGNILPRLNTWMYDGSVETIGEVAREVFDGADECGKKEIISQGESEETNDRFVSYVIVGVCGEGSSITVRAQVSIERPTDIKREVSIMEYRRAESIDEGIENSYSSVSADGETIVVLVFGADKKTFDVNNRSLIKEAANVVHVYFADEAEIEKKDVYEAGLFALTFDDLARYYKTPYEKPSGSTIAKMMNDIGMKVDTEYYGCEDEVCYFAGGDE